MTPDTATAPAGATADTATAPAGNGFRTAARRARFRDALRGVAHRSSSADLLRWILIPGGLAVLVGFNLMFLGWWGASRTHREIEQIPYLISGGLIGLGLVVLGGLLLASAFWIVVIRKMQEEADTRAQGRLDELDGRVAALANGGQEPTRRRTRPLTARSSPDS